MPPKQAAPPVQQKPKNFSCHCTIKNLAEPLPTVDSNGEILPPVSLVEGYRLRICSAWSNCSITTPLIGDKALPWVTNEGGGQSISFSYQFDGEVDSPEQLSSFHKNPFIYIFVFHVNTTAVKPSSFFAVDCSNFLLDISATGVCRNISENIEVSVSITNDKQLSELNAIIPLEPLRVKLKGLTAFPVYRNEHQNEAIDGTYMYGRLQLGPELEREILVFPSNTSADLNVTKSSPALKHPINQSIVVIPGLGNISRFHDSIASSTFTIEVHQDNILDRCFSAEHLAEFCKLLAAEPGGLNLPVAVVATQAAAAPAGGKKGAAPAKGATAAEAAVFTPNPTVLTASDRFLIQRLLEEMRRSSLICNHGAARFRLEQLLQQSNDLLTKFKKRRGENAESDHVVVSEELMLEVRLEKPSEPEKWSLPSDLSLRQALQKAKASRGKVEQPRVVKKPPRYELFLVNGTYLSMTAELHRHLHENVHQIDSASPFPLQLTLSSSTKEQRHEARNLSEEAMETVLKETPFTRMVIVMKYDNDEALSAFNEGLDTINSRALPNIQGTIRSYSLTEEEVEDAKKGVLDVISGFMVIDDDVRIVVIEGLAAPDKAMEWMYLDFLPKLKDNDESLSILVNPEVLFPERIYPTYAPDIKRIRVRGKLKKLARRPEIYNRLQVDEVCFEAVDSLMSLKRAEDLKTAKKLDVFPSSTSLNKFELLYGEAITRSDMDGTLKRAFVESVEQHKSRRELRSPSSPQAQVTQTGEIKLPREKHEFKFSDCRNPDFELHLQTRPKQRINYLAEHRELRKQAWLSMLHRRESRNKEMTKTIKTVLGLIDTNEKTSRRKMNSSQSTAEEAAAEDDQPLPKVYLYAGQSENFKEKAWNQLRDKIANDRNATYTFSRDFMSQNVSAVDEKREKKRQEELEKSARLTQKGFQYPKPKTIKELLSHPKKPSDARVEELHEPFFDITDKPPNDGENKLSPDVIAREKGFRTQVNGTALFGALELPRFEHDFQLKNVGDRENLPRGKLENDGVPNPHYFRSVHLGGENQARIVEEALEKEKEEWRTKVVVDDIAFKVGKMNVREKPIQSDKCADILHDEPKRKELVYLRERKGHRNTSLAHTATPLSILNNEAYAPNAGQKLLSRVADSSKFITAKLNRSESFPELQGTDDNAQPKDFMRFIHEGTNKSKVITMIAKKKHPPQDASEHVGPKWGPM